MFHTEYFKGENGYNSLPEFIELVEYQAITDLDTLDDFIYERSNNSNIYSFIGDDIINNKIVTGNMGAGYLQYFIKFDKSTKEFEYIRSMMNKAISPKFYSKKLDDDNYIVKIPDISKGAMSYGMTDFVPQVWYNNIKIPQKNIALIKNRVDGNAYILIPKTLNELSDQTVSDYKNFFIRCAWKPIIFLGNQNHEVSVNLTKNNNYKYIGFFEVKAFSGFEANDIFDWFDFKLNNGNFNNARSYLEFIIDDQRNGNVLKKDDDYFRSTEKSIFANYNEQPLLKNISITVYLYSADSTAKTLALIPKYLMNDYSISDTNANSLSYNGIQIGTEVIPFYNNQRVYLWENTAETLPENGTVDLNIFLLTKKIIPWNTQNSEIIAFDNSMNIISSLSGINKPYPLSAKYVYIILGDDIGEPSSAVSIDNNISDIKLIEPSDHNYEINSDMYQLVRNDNTANVNILPILSEKIVNSNITDATVEGHKILIEVSKINERKSALYENEVTFKDDNGYYIFPGTNNPAGNSLSASDYDTLKSIREQIEAEINYTIEISENTNHSNLIDNILYIFNNSIKTNNKIFTEYSGDNINHYYSLDYTKNPKFIIFKCNHQSNSNLVIDANHGKHPLFYLDGSDKIILTKVDCLFEHKFGDNYYLVYFPWKTGNEKVYLPYTNVTNYYIPR